MKNLFLACICSTLCFISCKKDDNTPTPIPNAAVTISSISPSTGPKNTVVTIGGTNFGTTTTALKVYFNNVEGTVLTATATEITVSVPATATTGIIKVEKNAVQVNGPVFTFLEVGATITFAGSTNGYADGTGSAAQFRSPTNITKDAAGNLYVADRDNNRIRKITPTGVVTTFAGSGSGGAIVNGTGIGAGFYSPYGLTIDGTGNLYVGEYSNHAVRKITTTAVVTTIAGNGNAGSLDGAGINATFNQPVGLAVDASGNIFIGDYLNNRIRKITPAGVVTTFAGSGNAALTDGTGTAASFNGPFALAFDGSGNLIVADYLNNALRKITAAGVVTTIAGNGTPGFADGTGTAARFNRPASLAIDPFGTIYLCDANNNKIRKVTSAGVVTTIAGNGNSGTTDGIGATAEFNYPLGLCGDFAHNTLYVADFANHRIRKVFID